MNTVYVVEHGSLLEGQESGGISTALMAKHKRKDQLIDKILIRAFDFNDRSVKLAAAPSPSSTFLLLTLTCVSLYELSFCSLSLPLSHHLELFDTGAMILGNSTVFGYLFPVN